MRCRQCGAEISENATFCGVCGKKVEKEVVQPQQEEKKNVKAEKNQNIEHYKNIQISEGLAERIEIIDKYIIEKEQEDKKVYILDAEAAVYMIPINNYNKDYDMFLKGNIGKDGEQGQIEKIKNKNENELYMIRKSELRTNWQTPIDVINYIRENLERVGEISIYEIYK